MDRRDAATLRRATRIVPLFVVWIVFLVSGCSPGPGFHGGPRPVKVTRIAQSQGAITFAYSGEVRARHETRLAFRVAGKVISRNVDLGNTVRQGQLIARLDPTDYELARQSFASQLDATRRERDLARDDLARYKDLLDQKLISPAEFDRREAAYSMSKSRADALEAQLKQASDQLDYTSLRADRDGVISAIFVEADQVLVAGQPVAALAQHGELEVAISVPEHQLAAVRSASDLKVSLWSRSEQTLQGRIREVSASADSASRTYSVRVSLKAPPPWVQLGMTANVSFLGAPIEGALVPVSALFRRQTEKNSTRVWIVDERTKTVKSTEVSVVALIRDELLAVDGLVAGQLVVVAGVNRLAEGAQVRIFNDTEKAPPEAQTVPMRSRL